MKVVRVQVGVPPQLNPGPAPSMLCLMPPAQVEIATGVWMPRVGFGTAAMGEGTRDAVLQALQTGYRHLDTAQVRGRAGGQSRVLGAERAWADVGGVSTSAAWGCHTKASGLHAACCLYCTVPYQSLGAALQMCCACCGLCRRGSGTGRIWWARRLRPAVFRATSCSSPPSCTHARMATGARCRRVLFARAPKLAAGRPWRCSGTFAAHADTREHGIQPEGRPSARSRIAPAGHQGSPRRPSATCSRRPCRLLRRCSRTCRPSMWTCCCCTIQTAGRRSVGGWRRRATGATGACRRGPRAG